MVCSCSNLNKRTQTGRPEELPAATCIHSYEKHIQRLQGGDYKLGPIQDEVKNIRIPPGDELAAFLDIGAEAERRNDMIIDEMKCDIAKYLKENEALKKENCEKVELLKKLQKKVLENENIIQSLTTEIDEMNNDILQINELRCQINNLEIEKEQMYQQNEELNYCIEKLTWDLTKLNEIHRKCPTIEDLICREEDICELSKKLDEAVNKIKHDNELIAKLKAENTSLSCEITQLSEQFEPNYIEGKDKNVPKQESMTTVKKQVTYPNEMLRGVKEGQTKPEISETLTESIPSKMSHSKICEQDRIIQEIISKMDQREKTIQHLAKIQTGNVQVTSKEYEELARIIEQQAYEINQLSNELQSKSLEDSESVDLLNEVTQLQYAVYDTAGETQNDSVDVLLRKIKRIRCRIKSRLKREDTRKKELARQLGLYRCQFINIQKEIEDLRKNYNTVPTVKDKIRLRLERETQISQLICQANKQKKELHSRCLSLTKALMNIDKVNEFVMHLGN